MRLIKTFTLAAIAVGALMAFLGASSASATSLEEVVLCKTLQDPCAAGNHFASGTIFHLLATNVVFLSIMGDIGCEATHVLGETTSLLAHGKITARSWLNCELEGEPCVLTTNNLPYLWKFELKNDHKGYEILETSGGLGRPTVRMQCASVDCSYGANTVLYEVLHTGVNGSVVVDVLQELTGEGFLCTFTSTTWHGKWEMKCLSGSSEVGCWPAMHSASKL
jgi:hypothetical protein